MSSRACRFVALSIAIAFQTGCAFVSLEPGAEGVRVIDEASSAGCEKLATTKVKVLDKVGFNTRSVDKMAEELETLARNAAAGLDGNAVASLGPIENGAQSFRVLRCPSSP